MNISSTIQSAVETKNARIVDAFSQKYPGKYLIVSRINDPLFKEGRARLIWRANTADAAESIGLSPAIFYQGTESRAGIELNQTLNRFELNQFYGTKLEQLTTATFLSDERNPRTLRRQAARAIKGVLLPFVGFVHCREPYILNDLKTLKIPFVYEDHNEDYHESARNEIAAILNNDLCKGVIAITQVVKASLIASGINPKKIVVLDSGVSERALEPRQREAEKCRRFYLKQSFNKLAVYSGGLQKERGIEHILIAAASLKNILFVIAGGNPEDVQFWRSEIAERNLHNVRITGYITAEDVWTLQQAADVLLMTRDFSDRMGITSPLKFFEYLASGRPIVKYKTTDIADASSIKQYLYDNANPSSLAKSIERAIKSNPWQPIPLPQHQDVARAFSWQQRALRVLELALSKKVD